jgi:hypothetical protein
MAPSDIAPLRVQQLARLVILNRLNAPFPANDTLAEIPENNWLTDDQWFDLMAEVERLVASAVVTIVFPEEQ